MYQRLTDTFNKIGVDHEIISVNDGCPDNSDEVIQSISEHDSHVIGITHLRKFGSQMAFRRDMELPHMQSVVLLDSDLQDLPELIEQFHELRVKGYDVVWRW
jgi:glycosyltransferase involved in cell wall biosynthesis